jgi:UMF1 family MFS transporter
VTSERKAVWGWALYDWANSAFATTVIALFFPIFFATYWNHGVDSSLATARLGLANSTAGLLVALLAPVLGAVADKASRRKKLLILFAYLGALMTGALFLVEQGQWAWAALVYAVGNIGFALANVFYDALLPAVAGTKKIDFVSGLGYAMGYLGGGILLAVNAAMVFSPQSFGLSDASEAVRYAFLTVSVWWGLFTLATVLWVPDDDPGADRPGLSLAVSAGLRQLRDTFNRIRSLKPVFLFLLAYWFYIDGVDTIIRMAVNYGLSIGFKKDDLVVALLIVQFVGFPAALAFGYLAQRWHPRGVIFVTIGAYVFITTWSAFMTLKAEFYALAVMIALVQGGIQASSRSYFARLIPRREQTAEFFGFYNMVGKFSVIIGPALVGGVGLAVSFVLRQSATSAEQAADVSQLASRLSIASVVVLFVIGAALLRLVKEERLEG